MRERRKANEGGWRSGVRKGSGNKAVGRGRTSSKYGLPLASIITSNPKTWHGMGLDWMGWIGMGCDDMRWDGV